MMKVFRHPGLSHPIPSLLPNNKTAVPAASSLERETSCHRRRCRHDVVLEARALPVNLAEDHRSR